MGFDGDLAIEGEGQHDFFGLGQGVVGEGFGGGVRGVTDELELEGVGGEVLGDGGRDVFLGGEEGVGVG